MNTETAVISAKEFGLEESQATQITSGLKTILEEREVLVENYKEVIKLDITDAENMKVFRELRLKIANNRTKGINVWHKTNKEYFLTGGRFVDAIKNKEIAENTRMEEALMEGEKYFENLEKEKKAELNKARLEQLAPYVEDTIGLDLSGMEEDVWDAYFSTKKAKFEATLAEQKRLEEEKLENERLDRLEKQRAFEVAPFAQFIEGQPDYRSMSEKSYSDLKSTLLASKKQYDKEQEEIRLENERLKKEREDEMIKQKKIEQERQAEIKKQNEAREAEEKKKAEIQAKKDAAIQAELKKEREAAEQLRKEKLDAEIAEAKIVEAEELKAKELAKAPVKEKLTLWVESFDIPENPAKNEVSEQIEAKFQSFKNWAQSEIEKI